MLVADGPAASVAIAEAWRAATRLCGADVLFLPFVRGTTRLYELASAHRGIIDVKQNVSWMAMLRDEPDWETLCKTLKFNGSRERRLAKQGQLDIRMLDLADGEYFIWVNWILSHKRDWAERYDKKGSWLYSPAYRDFLVGLLESAGGEPVARIFVLELNKTVIAAAMLGIGKGCHYYMIGTFVQRLSKLSAGTILIEYLVKWCLERGMDLDFGIGKEEYKAYWSRGNVKPAFSFQIANTRWGKFYFRSKDAARTLLNIRAARTRGELAPPEPSWRQNSQTQSKPARHIELDNEPSA
jgi:CelD/BcsL family acetyltransferase involved in cellulose biosynthesis